MIDTETARNLAEEHFTSGYNCCQSVVLAIADLLPEGTLSVDRKTLSRLACSFGGGMGRLREVCGTVSAMSLLLGLLYGYDTPETGSVKKEQYERVQKLALEFEQKHGTIICRKLLHLDEEHSVPTPEARTPSYYAKRPCKELAGDAAAIFAVYYNANPIPKG